MKHLLFFLMLGSALTGAAQSAVTSVSYNKSNQPGLMLELPYKEEVAEGFIVDNLKKTGYDAETKGKLFWKQNKLNGFYIFKEVMLEGAPQKLDLYFKVDAKGKGEKQTSVIYMLVGKGDGSFVYSSEEEIYSAAKKFLNGFTTQSVVYKLELDIKEGEERVKTAEKKMEKLKDTQKDLERKLEQLKKDMKRNEEEQEQQAKNIEEEKKKLLTLKSQRESK